MSKPNFRQIATDVVEEQTIDATDYEFEWDFDNIEVTRFDFSYGSVNDVEFDGKPDIMDRDIACCDKDTLINSIEDAMAGAFKELEGEDDAKLSKDNLNRIIARVKAKAFDEIECALTGMVTLKVDGNQLMPVNIRDILHEVDLLVGPDDIATDDLV